MFDITSVTADASDTIVSVGWTYTTDDGSLGGTHALAMPAGTAKVRTIKKATIIQWLKAQLGNTEEQLTEGIKKNKEAADKAAGLHEVPVLS